FGSVSMGGASEALPPSPPSRRRALAKPMPHVWSRRACTATADRAPTWRRRSCAASVRRASRKRATYPVTADAGPQGFAHGFGHPFVQGNEALFEFKTGAFTPGTAHASPPSTPLPDVRGLASTSPA